MLSKLGRMYDYQTFPKVERPELKYLWYSDYWDGPLSGLLLYKMQKYWFEAFAEAEDSEPYYRRFFIIELTPEQLQEEEQWHKLFQEKVGTHTDYDDEKRSLGELKPKSLWQEFYEPYQQRKLLDPSQNTIVGWFEER